MIVNRVVAWSTVVGAVVVLAFAIRLIATNTPDRPQGEARVMPPTQPNLTQSNQDGTAHSLKDAQRYIGGIGIVEPAGEAVSIGTQLPGVVREIRVQPGDRVKQGDILFVLDSRAARASLAVALANEQSALAKLKELQGQIAPTRTKVAASLALLAQVKADAENANQQYERARQLANSNSISAEEVETRRLQYDLSLARVAEAEARLEESEATLNLIAGEGDSPTLDVQRAAIAQAQSSVALEQINVDLHTIRAPLDSTVLQVKIRAGEFAAAAVLTNPLMVLGVTDPLHVRVEIDESEIPRFNANGRAYAAVRGRASEQVPLQFVRIEPLVVPKRSLSGGVSERVDTRVLQLIYSVSPTVLTAQVGQQVDVFIEELIVR